MKKITLFLLLLAAGAVNAQIVNIPDPVFKNILLNGSGNSFFNDLNDNIVTSVDINGDGEIQITEAQNIKVLYVNDNTITSIEGIEEFTNLTDLQITSNNIITIDVSVLTQIEHLGFTGHNIQTIEINGLANLKSLGFIGNSIQNINVGSLINLEELVIFGMNLESINLGSHPDLTSINIGSGTFENLNFNGCPNLQVLTLNGNFENIDISSCVNLEELTIYSSASTLTLNMASHPELERVGLYGSIPFIDLSECPNISHINLYIENVTTDTFVNLKNGNSYYENMDNDFSFDSSLYKCYVCIDEDENLFVNPINNNTYLSTYCTFTPGGDYNTIAGTITFDADNNGCSSSDAIFPFTSVQINDGTITGTSLNSNGTYNFYTQAGTFTLTPQFENEWFTTSPATVTFADNNNNTITQNFCVTANGVHNDAEVTIIPLIPARPGFDAVYKILYKNKGNQTLSGDVTFWYNDAVLDYVSALPAESAAATGSLSWTYYNLLPFESREILLTLNVNSPQETPAVNIGNALDLVATITPLTEDETPIDNTFALKQTVVGSYDPNDITCLEGATVNPDKIGDYLHYNINFENTGTYPASFVVVKDIIDTAKFDISSLVVLDASHAVEARVTGNKLEFYFADINLAANGGKGNVTFKIKSLETLAVNSSVMQKADIFFDYNWPIVTNEAVTTYALLNAPGFTKDTSVKLYPNPAKNVVTISAESAILNIQLFDVQGRLLEAISVNDITTTLDIASRANGIYFIKIATDKGMKVEKLVKE
jgi:Secretion system C-terminal sorting domain